MRRGIFFAGLFAGISMLAVNSAQAVEIEYWQYVYDTRVKAMDQLIANFEKANPDITVKQTTFPYADYQTRVVAANLAGNGPDVMQLFYGWLDQFIAGGLLQPLPTDAFPHDQIEKDDAQVIDLSDGLEPFSPVRGGHDVEPATFEGLTEHLAQIFFVVDDEQRALHGGSLTCAT